MKVAIVAYPELSRVDRDWVEAFRQTHDPQAARLAVHFTLVFPIEAAAEDLHLEIGQVARSTGPFTFTIQRTSVVPDIFGSAHQIFLVPDEGAAELTFLHDRLYGGILRPHLRSDLPFVPHLTVGACEDAVDARTLARTFDGRTLRGTVESMELVDVRQDRIRTVASYGLGDEAFE